VAGPAYLKGRAEEQKKKKGGGGGFGKRKGGETTIGTDFARAAEEEKKRERSKWRGGKGEKRRVLPLGILIQREKKGRSSITGKKTNKEGGPPERRVRIRQSGKEEWGNRRTIFHPGEGKKGRNNLFATGKLSSKVRGAPYASSMSRETKPQQRRKDGKEGGNRIPRTLKKPRERKTQRSLKKKGKKP